MARWLRAAFQIALATLVVLAFVIAATLYSSRPQLSGTTEISGLNTAVTISRDSIGHTTIKARSRVDLARAAGFVHAQERFLSMDTRRRVAAGEMAALFGPFATELDRENRQHRFRARAREIVADLPEEEADILRAYTQGVNQGLDALGAWPFPYPVLLARPEPWKMEDSILNLLAMHLVLQGRRWQYESIVGHLQEYYGKNVADFLAPVANQYDAPLDDSPVPFHVARIPGPQEFDLRDVLVSPENLGDVRMQWEQRRDQGSNAFAVTSGLAADGGALIANDMHLVLLMPNLWYRMHWEWTDGRKKRMASGLTLPGLPWLIAGSNGHIAWGFTNSNVDSQDLVLLETDEPSLTTVPEVIEVRFSADETLAVRESAWGPVINEDSRGRQRALRWLSHLITGEQVNFSQIERAENVRDALLPFQKSAVPSQNVVIADRAGDIAWTIAGPLLRRDGYNGRTPVRGHRIKTQGEIWLPAEQYPVIINPPGKRIWSANSRHVGGDAFSLLGDGRYTGGMRAQQLRDRLQEKEVFRAEDLWALQLDNRADYLDEWRPRLQRAMNVPEIADLVERHDVREWIARWNGHSDADSVGYRIIRTFRKRTHELFMLVVQTRLGLHPDREMRHLRWQLDGPLSRAMAADARHLLPRGFRDWDEFLALALRLTIEEMTADGKPMAEQTWGVWNTARIRHPLSFILPPLSRFLDAPASPLSGDLNLPRVEHRGFGASHRTVVSPGREDGRAFWACRPGSPVTRCLRSTTWDIRIGWKKGRPRFCRGLPCLR